MQPSAKFLFDEGEVPHMSFCFKNPKAEDCEDDLGYYLYDINLAPNAAFLAIFTVSLIGIIVIWVITRRGTAFNVAMMLGLLCEIIGYAGRIVNWHNRFDLTAFITQICCLTIGPAFMAAGIYLCLRRIVTAFGPENSRLPPEYYTRFFIPCDIVSLFLQAFGGGLVAAAAQQYRSTRLGTDIMIAGLASQAVTIFIFVVCSVDFAIRSIRRQRVLGEAAFDQRPEITKVRNSHRFKAFICALSLSAFFILSRSVFRVAELCRGWTGPLMANQYLFVVFEGILIAVSVISLNIFHPSLCMKELLGLEGGGLRGIGCFRKCNETIANGESVDCDGKTPTSEAVTL
ncbi:hypothetical protein IL306_009329 [Fusarium sp. DS 682]|nr:hypothetical protein IL306_009329 [Fusarium sp. DS 682]